MKLRDNRYRFNKSTRNLRLVENACRGEIIKTRESIMPRCIYCKEERWRKNWNEIRIRMKSRSVCDANVGLMLPHSLRLSANFQRCFSKSFFTSESLTNANLILSRVSRLGEKERKGTSWETFKRELDLKKRKDSNDYKYRSFGDVWTISFRAKFRKI